ncbi:hypothetical protein CEXT_717611 [Caerostris extrusa]|uniref:LIM zinc-binding domain-containing protein n=1 Tax=Caerostris extrusa TaxID=172846 RepID=A0AAV4NKW8_CAEEX|nr:hypothetical protein CEXT_717611 [Caerostris extrusa]
MHERVPVFLFGKTRCELLRGWKLSRGGCSQELGGGGEGVAQDGYIEILQKLFAVKRCARCQRGIFANELVMRARDLVYHLHCFTCAWCNTALTQGDYFGLRDNLVYCRGHYELMVHGESFLPNGTEGPALLPR